MSLAKSQLNFNTNHYDYHNHYPTLCAYCHYEYNPTNININTCNVSGCKWPIIGRLNARSTFSGGFDGPAPNKRFSRTSNGPASEAGFLYSTSSFPLQHAIISLCCDLQMKSLSKTIVLVFFSLLLLLI